MNDGGFCNESEVEINHRLSNRSLYSTMSFYTETLELSRISALSFFEAGEDDYSGERFFWQNAEKTMTIVGIGHAHIIKGEGEERFEMVRKKWEVLCSTIVKEDPDIAPVLFGGFSFDPDNRLSSEWNVFPDAYFVVPTFQLVIKHDRAYVTINHIAEEPISAGQFDALRMERDHLIHAAQVRELNVHVKPVVTKMEERNKELYMEAVEEVTKLIRKGQADKVVIARSLKLSFDRTVTSSSALAHVSNEQPESFHFGLELGGKMFFGATPERLVKVEKGKVLSTCLAGSIRRGKTADEDRVLGLALLNDPKNRSEHQYVVDMISTVMEQYCDSVRIPRQPKLLKIRDIQHLFTPVQGTLKKDSSLFQFVESLHPTPALGGEPREVAMDIIRSAEQMNRGYYAAPVGWIDGSGDGEFAVAIRSALLDGQEAYLYAGGGIVADSQPVSEYEETKVKFRPMLRTLGGQLNG